MQKSRTFWVPMWCWVIPMHQTIVLGRFSAMVLAIRFILSSGDAGDVFHHLGGPFLGLLADLIHAVDARAR